jgi:hypothetical protein
MYPQGTYRDFWADCQRHIKASSIEEALKYSNMEKALTADQHLLTVYLLLIA